MVVVVRDRLAEELDFLGAEMRLGRAVDMLASVLGAHGGDGAREDDVVFDRGDREGQPGEWRGSGVKAVGRFVGNAGDLELGAFAGDFEEVEEDGGGWEPDLGLADGEDGCASRGDVTIREKGKMKSNTKKTDRSRWKTLRDFIDFGSIVKATEEMDEDRDKLDVCLFSIT